MRGKAAVLVSTLVRAERSAVRAVQDRVESAPGADHRLPVLAAAASLSVRHFTRVFTTEVGQSPGRFVERVRLEAARTDLGAGDDTLDVVAERCGLGSAESLRRIITAAGVSAGIDMALRLTELLADPAAAQAAQLMIEYDPQPPFDCGARAKAGDAVMARVREYDALRQ